MDLQNVSNINVPQGEVRTIHDKDNRLLWGRVSYDTTYRGDTQQTTYTGKNLFNYTASVPYTGSKVTIDGRQAYEKDSPGSTLATLSESSFTFRGGVAYTISFDAKKSSSNDAFTFDANGGYVAQKRVALYAVDGGDSTLTTSWRRFYFTVTPNNDIAFTQPIHLYFIYDRTGTFQMSNIQIEQGSSATTYEPYTGAIPSPNPNYPQDISVVGGEQKVSVRTGKNMIDISSASVGYLVLHTNGELGPNPNYSASDWIPVKAGSHYYQTATNVWYACYYDKNKNFIAQINSRYIRPTQDGYIRTSWENTKADQVMMEVGDSGTTYEPYMGKSYTVGLTSKNLFDSSLLPANWSNAAIITITLKVKPNTKYTMSSDIPLDRGLYANLFFYDNSGTGSTATNGVATNKPVTVTTSSDGILKVGYRSNYQSTIIYRDDYWYQIEEGETVTPYTPFFTPIELAKVGTYQDYIYKSGGNWYVHKAVGKGVLDGSENDWGYQNGVFRTFFDDAMRDINAVLVMSDYFTGQTTRYRDDISNSCCAKVIGANSQIGFRYDAMNGDVPTWKSWLSTHNTTIYYVLATATNTQITDVTLLSQLNAVHQWLTRYGYQYGVVGTLPIIIDQEELN